jgi:hypothetical protein
VAHDTTIATTTTTGTTSTQQVDADLIQFWKARTMLQCNAITDG